MSMLSNANFKPLPGQTKTISATASSSSVQFLTQGKGRSIRIFNAGSATTFVRLGKGSATALVADDMPIPSGAIEVFDFGLYDTIAGITASSTATVYVTLGEGRG